MDSKKIIVNILIVIITLAIFVLSIESLYKSRLIEAFFFIFLVVLLILFFFKINWDYFDNSKEILALE